MTTAPYICIKSKGNEYEFTGIASAKMGHRLDSQFSRSGVFSEWTWRNDCLTVTNDRYGIYPLFYSVDNENLMVSPSLTKLIELGASRELDQTALAVFFRAGIFLGGDTPFKQIRRIPPNAVFQWKNGRLKCSGSLPESRRSAITRRSAIDEYIHRFRSSIARHLASIDSRTILPLSGGQDSRHILFEMHNAGQPPSLCVTFRFPPPGYLNDFAIAEKLCNALGVPQKTFACVSDRFGAEMLKNRLTHFLSKEHAQYLALDSLWDEEKNVFAFDGLGGDVLSAATFWTRAEPRQLYDQGELDKLADYLMCSRKSPLGHCDERTLVRLLNSKALPGATRAAAKQRIVSELEHHLSRHNRLRSFYIANRTTLDASLPSCCMLPSNVTPLFPFFDNAVYDFLTSLPSEMLCDGTFHKETIHRAFPEYKDIPFAGKAGGSIRRLYWRKFHFRQIARILSRTGGTSLHADGYVLARAARGLLKGQPGNFVDYYTTYLSQLSEISNR